MRENVLDTLDKINERLDSEQAPEVASDAKPEVVTPVPVAEAAPASNKSVDDLLLSMAEAIMEEFELEDEDEAIDLLFDVLDEMVEAGEIPPVPAEDASADEEAEWVAGAESNDLLTVVIDELSDEDSEDPSEE